MCCVRQGLGAWREDCFILRQGGVSAYSCAEGDGPCSLRDGKLVVFITQYSSESAEEAFG